VYLVWVSILPLWGMFRINVFMSDTA
jgi:hypothetical protein